MSRVISSAVSTRVRDRHLIQVAAGLYGRTASVSSADRVLTAALVEAVWESQPSVNAKTAFLGITKAISKILDLIKKVPHFWDRISDTFEIDDWDEMNLVQKTKALGSKLGDLIHEGKAALGKAFKEAVNHFPLNLFFVPHKKMPGLTDLLKRISDAVPWINDALKRVHNTAISVDKLFEKYIPTLRKPIYAAIFIWVWVGVSEISWDVHSILQGFTGNISLSELLGSMPESGIGLIAASFGLGYGALPYAIIARLMWLVAQDYIKYEHGGFKVDWAKMGIRQRSEFVPA